MKNKIKLTGISIALNAGFAIALQNTASAEAIKDKYAPTAAALDVCVSETSLQADECAELLMKLKEAEETAKEADPTIVLPGAEPTRG